MNETMLLCPFLYKVPRMTKLRLEFPGYKLYILLYSIKIYTGMQVSIVKVSWN